jgi:hypothetical protein
MLMTKSELARVAKNLRETLEKEALLDVDAVREREGDAIGDHVDSEHAGEEVVQVSEHPQRPGALVVSYFRRTGQTPLQLILNPARNQIKVMLTCVDELEGYTAFDEEPDFGKMQDKSLPGLDLAAAISELGSLAELK